MTSIIERDFVVKDGVVSFPMKEYPNWYGIPNIGYIRRGEWNDSALEYNGKIYNVFDIEIPMWDRWIHDENGDFLKEREDDEEGFAQFIRDNVKEVYELLENITEEK